MSLAPFIVGPMRPRFLILALACVLLGIGTAVREVGHVSILYAVLALIGGVAAHASVNCLNEYCDCKSGLDEKTTKTPFSGGTGTLPPHPEMAHVALITGLVTMAITGLIGVFFLIVRGIAIVPLGIMGLIVIAAYTPFITRMPGVCLIAPGLGFGVLMVMGTHFVLTGHYSWVAFVASLVPFFLVNDLLLLNQFPDVEPDRSIGRNHIPILLGLRRSSEIYALFLLLAYVSIVFGVAYNYLPRASLLGLATVLIAVPVVIGTFKNAADVEKLKPSMALNVVINIATPVLMAVGLIVGK
jgi:1,4-dihydroxy-2-naphthoate octaprenyltransferase